MLDRLAAIMAILLLAATPAPGQGPQSQDPSGLTGEGGAIFLQRCSPCHTIGGGDRPTGPDLAEVTERRERAWLVRYIREPDRMKDEGDPTALELQEKYKMPMPPVPLADEEMEALLAFLDEEVQLEVGAAPEVPADGDPRQGQALYTGTTSFANGGAPCLACHGIAGLGAGGGANLGVDLTGIYEDYGEEGLAAVLEDLSVFPSMTPIYAGRPLIETERADLAAFLQEVSGRQMPETTGRLVRDVVIGTVVLLLVLLLFGWRRLQAVRRPLVDMRKKKGEER
jgi:mono/diheme cytochrome c family protein